jgi:SNF2 family DNA or RNA helicase
MAASFGNVTSKALLKLQAKYRLGLSGTPIRNKFENAWTIVRWLEPALMPLNFWVWRLRYCATEYDRFGPQQRKVTGELVPGQLFNSLTCYIQHLQRERCCSFHPRGFLAGLPEPLRIERVVDMAPAQRKFYQEMEKALVSELQAPDEKTGRARVMVDLPVEARSMLRMCALGLPYAVMEPFTDAYGQKSMKARLHYEDDCLSPKLDMLISDLPSYEGEHTVILTHSKRFAKVAVDRLTKNGYATEGWHGDITKNKRDKVLASFLRGDTKIIVGVIAAMGTGTDGLQEVCRNLSWLSRDDDPSNNTQGIGRLDRLGQSKQVVTREYISAGTIEQGMYSKELLKVLNLNKSLRRAA